MEKSRIFIRISIVAAGICAYLLFLSSAEALGTLKVDSITPVNTSAVADGNFGNGWKWIFDITVPDTETVFKMKFADLKKGSDTILAGGNIRISSEQSSNASGNSPIVLSGANLYSDRMDLIAGADLNSAKEGIQIKVTVEIRVPVNSVNGSYTTSYSVFSDTNNTSFVRLLSPNGGQTFASDSANNSVTWEAQNTGLFTINMESKSGTFGRNLASDLDSSRRSATFTMPIVPAGEYRIYITDGLGVNDYGDGYFNVTTTAEQAIAISEIPEIVITSPVGGESLRTGDSLSIRWMASPVVGRLIINMENEARTFGLNIASDIDPSLRTHIFTLQQQLTPGRYKVSITDGRGAAGFANDYITIVGQ